MFKNEQSIAVPSDFPIVFECCVLALRDANVRVKSANSASGVVSGRTYSLGIYSMDRIDVHVGRAGAGQCTVTATSESSGVAITDYGRNTRNVERFFNALMARTAPLVGRASATSAITSPTGSLPSSKYSSAPMRTQLRETSAGQAYQWMKRGCVLLFLLLIVIVALSIMANALH